MSLERCLFRSSANFFTELVGSLFVLLSCMSCLYILEINPSSVASFANIFSVLRVSFCFANKFTLNRTTGQLHVKEGN